MSAEKTLAILDLFTLDQRAFNVAEIAEQLEQPQSSVYRHLKLLKDKGYIVETHDGQYKIGYRFLKMAKIVRAENNLISIAKPMMIRLGDISKETIILAVRSRYHAVCLENVPSFQPIKVTSEQGGIMPLHCGASSKVLLAHTDDLFIDGLFEQGLVEKYTEKTITDKNKLKQHLQEIKENGYASSVGEIDDGVLAYGVPIFNMDDQIVGSLSIAGPKERMANQDKTFYIDQLITAVAEMQEYL